MDIRLADEYMDRPEVQPYQLPERPGAIVWTHDLPAAKAQSSELPHHPDEILENPQEYDVLFGRPPAYGITTADVHQECIDFAECEENDAFLADMHDVMTRKSHKNY